MAYSNKQWQAVVNIIMNLWVPYNVREFSTNLSTLSY